MSRIETTDNNLGLYDLTNYSENDIKELKYIADIKLQEKINKNPNLLVFPYCTSNIRDNLLDNTIISIDENSQKLRTGNIMGFVGINSTKLSIISRFALDRKHDYFLHYKIGRAHV